MDNIPIKPVTERHFIKPQKISPELVENLRRFIDGGKKESPPRDDLASKDGMKLSAIEVEARARERMGTNLRSVFQ